MRVSKCCGKGYTMEVIRAIILASDRVIKPQTPGQIQEKTPICRGCLEPCQLVLKGYETKPWGGAIYCQTCARRLLTSGRVPKDELRYPAGGGIKEPKTTCWGCGKTTMLAEASTLVER
jgi:hypothetical protein